jgi:hypothetical protein
VLLEANSQRWNPAVQAAQDKALSIPDFRQKERRPSCEQPFGSGIRTGTSLGTSLHPEVERVKKTASGGRRLMEVIVAQGLREMPQRINNRLGEAFSSFQWLVAGYFDEYTDGSDKIGLFLVVGLHECVSR